MHVLFEPHYFQDVLPGKIHKIVPFFNFRPCVVESLFSVAQFETKCTLLTQLLHEELHLLAIVYHQCSNLTYHRVCDIETILCNIYIALGELLYDQFGVRHILVEDLILPARHIASMRDICCADMELVRVFMIIMLDLSNTHLHWCEVLILFKNNIIYWVNHLKCYLHVAFMPTIKCCLKFLL